MLGHVYREAYRCGRPRAPLTSKFISYNNHSSAAQDVLKDTRWVGALPKVCSLASNLTIARHRLGGRSDIYQRLNGLHVGCNSQRIGKMVWAILYFSIKEPFSYPNIKGKSCQSKYLLLLQISFELLILSQWRFVLFYHLCSSLECRL